MTISRRSLLKSSLGGIGLFAGAQSVMAATPQWDETVDVIVVGSGFAGLMAAYMAKKAGCEVVILEKMPTAGGNSIINGGIMGVPGTEIQKVKGIKDSPEQMAQDMLKAGLYMNYPEKVKALTEEALPAYNVLVNELGVEFSDTILKHEGGHSVPRSCYLKNGSGSGIVTKQLEALKKLGVKPRVRCCMEKIILNDKGEVEGLQVREGYRFPRENSGKVKMIRAKKGIVLAYGGFGADPQYRVIFDPKLGEKFQSTNQPGATGQAWRVAAQAGVQMTQNDWIQCLPYTSPDEKGFGLGWAWAGHTQAYGFWIDAATGERFVNELADRKIRSDAIMIRANQGHECLSVGDKKCEELFQVIRPGWTQRILKNKVCMRYDTLEEMAKAHNIPLDKLKQTIAEVNKSVETKVDPLGRRVNADLKPQTEGPWYVTRLLPKVHHCMGGILTTPKAEVVSVTGKVIPGLYAAGEATGGVHGAVRLGSCAITDCIANGMIAGREVAKR